MLFHLMLTEGCWKNIYSLLCTWRKNIPFLAPIVFGILRASFCVLPGSWVTWFFSSWERNSCLQSWDNLQNDSYFHSKRHPRTILSENSCQFVKFSKQSFASLKSKHFSQFFWWEVNLRGLRWEIFGLWLLSFCQNERSWPKKTRAFTLARNLTQFGERSREKLTKKEVKYNK